MSVHLVPMNEADFNRYYNTSVKKYAAEHVKAGTWSEKEALQNAQSQFAMLLPDGLHTPGQSLFSAVYRGEKVGIVWLNIQPVREEKHAFIFDIVLDEKYRGKGLGKKTMEALERYAALQGSSQIRLHVFAHNKRAIALYEKLGYDMTNHYMMKYL